VGSRRLERGVPGAGGRPVADRPPASGDPCPAMAGGGPLRSRTDRRARSPARACRPAPPRPPRPQRPGAPPPPGRAAGGVSRPRMVFLDEPPVGLDPRTRAELIDVIAGLRDRGETTIFLTTHYLDEAERLCDRLAVMHEGRIVALGAPATLRAELGERIVE